MRIKEFVKNNYSVFIAPVLTVTVLIFAYAVGGVFPFGSNNVEYYDMAQGIIPNFYHIWDALHKGDVSLWFNWYSGLGVNDTANASLSAFWIILLISPRRLVGKLMSFYVVMMLSLSSFTAGIYLKKEHNTAPFITTVLSLCYGFCGFSVMYYTNAWQDTVYLFPLFILAWTGLMKKGRCLPYILMIILNLLCGYYVFLLALFYVFFMSFLYLLLRTERQERSHRALQLGLSTALGIGVSAFFLVPKLVQTFSSERFIDKTGFDFSNIFSQYWDIAATVQCSSYDKIAMLFCTALPLAIIVIGIIRNRGDKKTNLFFVLNILLMAVLIVCEGANALMHFGDYKFFPMRMGYALSFGMIWAAGYYSKFLKLKANELSKKSLPPLLFNAVCFVIIFCAVYFIMKKVNASNEFVYSCVYALPFLFVGYLFLLSRFNRFFNYRIVISALLAEVLILSSTFIPYWNTDQLSKEHSPKYIAATQSLVKSLDIEESKTDRVKTIGTTLNTNYGTVGGFSTIADWTHLVPHEVQKSLIAMGYSGEYTRLHDSGGTAFTDALLGVKNVLSVKAEDDSLYTLVGKAKGYKYYKCRYTLPYGIAVSDEILNIDTENSDWREINNKLYTALSGDGQELVTDSGLKLVSAEGDTEVYTFRSAKNTVAYFRLDGAKSVNIFIDGKKIKIPSVDNEKNKRYPGRFNRNLICLGSFGDRDVEVTLVFNDGKYEDKEDFRDNNDDLTAEKNRFFGCEVGLLSLEKLGAVCNMYTEDYAVSAKNYSLSAKADVGDNNDMVLLLPLQYNGCWSAEVNGNREQVLPVMNLLSAVRLASGDNSVELHYSSSGFDKGVIISVISVIACILLFVMKKKGVTAPKWICSFIYLAYAGAFCIAVICVYAVPLAYFGYRLVTDFSNTIDTMYIIDD